MSQSLYARIEFKGETGQGIDLEAERNRLAQLFDKALRQANLGYWSGSAIKGNGTLIFYFKALDLSKVAQELSECFDGYDHRSNFKGLHVHRL